MVAAKIKKMVLNKKWQNIVFVVAFLKNVKVISRLPLHAWEALTCNLKYPLHATIVT
jgi:hypothetical protein